MLSPLMNTVGSVATPHVGAGDQQVPKTDKDTDFARIFADQDSKISLRPQTDAKLTEAVDDAKEMAESEDTDSDVAVTEETESDLAEFSETEAEVEVGDGFSDSPDEDVAEIDDALLAYTDVDYVPSDEGEIALSDGDEIAAPGEITGQDEAKAGSVSQDIARADAMRVAMMGGREFTQTPPSSAPVDETPVTVAEAVLTPTQTVGELDEVTQATQDVSPKKQTVAPEIVNGSVSQTAVSSGVSSEDVTEPEAPVVKAAVAPGIVSKPAESDKQNEQVAQSVVEKSTKTEQGTNAPEADVTRPKPRVVQSRPLPEEAIVAAKADFAAKIPDQSVSSAPAAADAATKPIPTQTMASTPVAEMTAARPGGDVSVQEQSESRLYSARRDSNLTAPAQEAVQFDSRQNLKTAPQSVREAVLAAAPSSDAQTPPVTAPVNRADAAANSFVFPASNATNGADVQALGEVDPELGLDVKAVPRTGQASQAEPKPIDAVQQAMASHAETRATTAKAPKPTVPPQVAPLAQGEAQSVEDQTLSVRAEDMSKSSEFVQVVQQGSAQKRDVPLTSAMAQATGAETSLKAVAPVSTGQEIASGVADGAQDAVIEQALSQVGESRSSGAQTTTAAPQQPQQQARAEAANVMRQVSENLQKMSNGGVEIRLSPEELGSVRLQMAPSEHGMVVTIQADRPETLELMRRNIDQLAQDLAAAGYEGAEFSFGDDGQGTESGGRGQMASAEPVVEEQDAEPRPQTTTDGLDIRV